MILLQQNFYFHPLIRVESFLNTYIYKMENKNKAKFENVSLLNDYLKVRLPFRLGERVYEGDLSDNSLINEFLKKNYELRELMNQGRNKTQRK